MKTINAYRAQDVGNVNIVEPFTIVIGEQIPDFQSLEDAEERYKDEAEHIAWALTHSLPGGTLHQLTIKLIEHKLNLFKGPDVK